MNQMRAKLYELEEQKRSEQAQIVEDNKADIGWGSQIRSYVLDQSRVKDLRTNFESARPQTRARRRPRRFSAREPEARACKRRPMADDGQENRLIAERRAKLARLREAGNAYPNDFRRDALADELLAAYQSHSAESLAATPVEVRVAGRLMVKRVMGGTSFVKLQDRSGQIQLMLKRDRLGEALYGEFKKWDFGDIVAARGELIKTQDRRAVGRRRRAPAAREVAAAAAGEVARHHGCRDEAAAALRRSHHERRDARGVSAPQRADPLHPQLPRRARFHRGRDADDAADPGRRDGAAVRDASQRARRDALPAHRAGALPEAACSSAASSASTS